MNHPLRGLPSMVLQFLLALVLGALPLRSTAASGWQEDFSNGMSRWWTEGGERAWVDEGRLHLWADAPEQPGGGVATVWCRRPLPADFELEVDAHVTSSSIKANNINLFLCYADPSGRPLEVTRGQRSSAAYGLYHTLNGYIVTFLNEKGKARVRLRRNPGFVLLAERYEGECRAGVTYRLKVRKQNGELIFSVDGRELARAKDPEVWIRTNLIAPGLPAVRWRLRDLAASSVLQDYPRAQRVEFLEGYPAPEDFPEDFGLVALQLDPDVQPNEVRNDTDLPEAFLPLAAAALAVAREAQKLRILVRPRTDTDRHALEPARNRLRSERGERAAQNRAWPARRLPAQGRARADHLTHRWIAVDRCRNGVQRHLGEWHDDRDVSTAKLPSA